MRKESSFIKRLAAGFAVFTILAPGLVIRGANTPNTKPLTEDQKILHVLNRLGFGARPGDVAREPWAESNVKRGPPKGGSAPSFACETSPNHEAQCT